MAQTLYDKLWDSHVVHVEDDGTAVLYIGVANDGTITGVAADNVDKVQQQVRRVCEEDCFPAIAIHLVEVITIDGKQFDTDREQVIARARETGVRTMVAIGNGDGPPTLDAGIRLAEQHSFMYATVGIHPHEARLASDHAYIEMEQLARHPKVIAWGEIGLDYHYDHSPRETQKRVFARQMELAAAAKLPIVIQVVHADFKTVVAQISSQGPGYCIISLGHKTVTRPKT